MTGRRCRAESIRTTTGPGSAAPRRGGRHRTWQVFTRILAPLLVPGILAASILLLVRTVSVFEPTLLTYGPDSQTLVVALFTMLVLLVSS